MTPCPDCTAGAHWACDSTSYTDTGAPTACLCWRWDHNPPGGAK